MSFILRLRSVLMTSAPLMTTIGIDSLLSPITNTPIVARQSAVDLKVTLNFFPKRSFLPLSSSTGSNPQTPTAIPVHPILVGMSLLSDITIAILIPSLSENFLHICLADLKEFFGQSIILLGGQFDLLI